MGVNTTSPKPRRPNERERLQETDSFVVHPEDPTTLRAKRHTERERLLSENADSDSDSSPSPAKTSKKREPPAKKKKQEQDEESGKTKKKIVETGIIKMVAIFGSEKAKTKALSKKPEMEETLAKYKEFYSEIKTEFDKAVDAELAEEFTHWFQEEDQYIPKDSKHTMEKCPVNLVHENSSIFWDKPETDDDGAMNRKNKHKKHQVSHTRIECGDLLPPMNYYVPIEQSINTKDQLRLTHMPYFCDGQADENLFDKLVDVFPDGIHGFSDNYGYVNDWLVYKLLRKALEAESTPTCPDIIYYNIYRVWPNKLTQRELSVEFPKLCERFAEEKLDPRVLEPWKPHAEQEVALNIRNLDCYSCLSYMCPIHGFKAELPPDFPSGDFYQVTVPLLKPNDTNFCSSKCWKHVKLSKVADVLKPTEEEVRNFKVTMYMDKARLIKMPAEDGALLASIYGAESKIPFCKFAADNVDPHDDDEENKIRSCRDAYELIISLVERPSESRLKLTRPAKQINHQERCAAFRREKMSQEKMKRKLRHEKLRRQARDKGLDSAELIAADDKKELKKNAEAVRLEAVTPLTACRHDGPCNPLAANCACSENGVCSYMCKCDINCAQRFPGCNCAAGQCQTKACQCFRARWECNPMTCSSCRCDKIDSQTTGCANYAMTRMIQKRMLCAPSRIAGNGLFLLEGAEKDEFITEYVGERISDDEAERRGAIYDRYHCSYIFNLETGGAIDSYRVGNLARFANHDDKNPSLYARTMVVAGEHRIGFYAKRRLEPNDELTFDYSYSGEHQEVFELDGKADKKKNQEGKVRKKNAN